MYQLCVSILYAMFHRQYYFTIYTKLNIFFKTTILFKQKRHQLRKLMPFSYSGITSLNPT